MLFTVKLYIVVLFENQINKQIKHNKYKFFNERFNRPLQGLCKTLY